MLGYFISMMLFTDIIVIRGDHFKTRFRRTFEDIMQEEEQRLRRNLSENERPIAYNT